MGVAGIALASSWGVILGTAFFVLAGYQWGDINPGDTTLDIPDVDFISDDHFVSSLS